ncbi:MAG: hypothetical protein ABI992_09980 [Chthoniobacterales bacterium]
MAVLLVSAHTFAAPKPAAPHSAGARTIRDLPNFPMDALRVGVSRPLFRSLQVSPISTWEVARATLGAGHTNGAKIIHAEGNGAYDQMLLEMANGYHVTGQNSIESRAQTDTLDVHLLIYEIKDGKMAVCFSHNDDARYAGYGQGGIAWVGIWRDGKWTTISGSAETKWGGRR